MFARDGLTGWAVWMVSLYTTQIFLDYLAEQAYKNEAWPKQSSPTNLVAVSPSLAHPRTTKVPLEQPCYFISQVPPSQPVTK